MWVSTTGSRIKKWVCSAISSLERATGPLSIFFFLTPPLTITERIQQHFKRKLESIKPKKIAKSSTSGSFTRLGASPLRSGDHRPLSHGPLNYPVTCIPGSPGILRHHILNDRRRVLALDSEGYVTLWDIARVCIYQSFCLPLLSKETRPFLLIKSFHLIVLGSLGSGLWQDRF